MDTGSQPNHRVVRDAVDDDIDLFGDRLASFHEALAKPYGIGNMQEAVNALAAAAAPFGRLRQQLNEAIAKEAVRPTGNAS